MINTDTWEQRKLGEVSDVRDGTHDSPKYQSIGHPFVTSKNVKNGYITYDDIQYISDEDFAEINKRSKVDINDILMGMIGTIGNMALIRTEPDFAIKNVALIKDTKQINYLYLYHLLQSPFIEKQLTSGMDGGTQKFVSLGNVRNLNVIYPSDIEQDKIGCYFEKLDHLITLHQRKLFLNFAKRNDWEQRKLGDYCDMYNGDRSSKYPNAQDMVVEGIPFINAGDLANGHVNLTTCNKISREKYDDLGGAKLQLGDIVYCLRGTLGKNAYIDNFPEGTVASSLVAIRPKNIDGRYLFHVLNSDIEYRQRVVHDEGAAQPNLSAKSVSGFMIPIPHIDEQKKISEYFDNLDTLITLHRRAYYNKKGGLTNVHNDNQQHYAIL